MISYSSLKSFVLQVFILFLVCMIAHHVNAQTMNSTTSVSMPVQTAEWINSEATDSASLDDLTNIYQLMRNGQYIQAEQQLANQAKENPGLNPLWIALLVELENFEKISQLAAYGVIDKQDSSVKLASLYQDGAQPEIVFRENREVVSLKKHWLVSIPRIIVTIEGHDVYFLIDSGASTNVITRNVADLLGLKQDASLSVSFDTSVQRQEQGVFTRLPDINIGSVVARHQNAVVVDNAMLEQKILGINWYKIDGILGWPIIKKLLIKLDYHEEKIVIEKPTDNDGGIKNLVWLFDDPIVFTEKGDNPQFVMFLDTGAQSSQVTSGYLNKVDVGELKWKSKRFNAIGGQGEPEQTAKLEHMKFSLPSQDVVVSDINVRVGHRDCIYTNCDGRIGIDSIKNKVMTIDFHNGLFDISNKEY